MILIFGNSGSGKSTLAARLAREGALAHLDLDTIAWEAGPPPVRRDLAKSVAQLERFLADHPDCVVEGCYADLLAAAAPRCTRMIFLDPGVEACVDNARARPWEPHKYASKTEQDANLGMLIGWIREYETRSDVFSRAAHRALFDGFTGIRHALTTREAIRDFAAPAP